MMMVDSLVTHLLGPVVEVCSLLHLVGLVVHLLPLEGLAPLHPLLGALLLPEALRVPPHGSEWAQS